jgi:peptide/nickel transport system ATP-binding protein
MADAVLEVKNLEVVYETFEGVVRAVNGINLRLNAGETLGLVGESGAGKTTTALSILNLIPKPPGRIKAGNIFFQGRDLLSLSEKEMNTLRGNKISMIFQDPMTSLNPVVPISTQLTEVIQAHTSQTRKQAREQAMRMLEMVQIQPERMDNYPHEFSGGMRQRVGIAMALVCRPSLLLADEPTTALDVTIQAQVLSLMNDLKDELDTSMIMITHDLGVVAEICDKVAVMYAGEILEQGTLEQVFGSPLHPYTKALFKCTPDIEAEESAINPIEGLMPDPINLPKGCCFEPRCPRAMPICKKVKPKVTDKNGQKVICHLYSEEGVKIHA